MEGREGYFKRMLSSRVCPMVLAACGEIHGKGKVKNLNVREYRGGMSFFLYFINEKRHKSEG